MGVCSVFRGTCQGDLQIQFALKIHFETAGRDHDGYMFETLNRRIKIECDADIFSPNLLGPLGSSMDLGQG